MEQERLTIDLIKRFKDLELPISARLTNVHVLRRMVVLVDGNLSSRPVKMDLFGFQGLPTTPNITAGFFLVVPRADTIELDMSVDAALSYIISMGVAEPLPRDQKTPNAH